MITLSYKVYSTRQQLVRVFICSLNTWYRGRVGFWLCAPPRHICVLSAAGPAVRRTCDCASRDAGRRQVCSAGARAMNSSRR